MDFSLYKLVVSDLDGTLVRFGTQEVSNLTKDVIRSLYERNILFTIATGRSWKQSRPIVKELAVSIPVILQSGAIIMDPITEQVIKIQPLRKSIAKKLHQIYKSPHVDLFCLDEGGTYFATQLNTTGGSSFFKNYQESCWIGERHRMPETPVKHLFIGPENVLQEMVERIIREVHPCPNWILWPPDPGNQDFFLEVFDPLASKGQAVKWLSDYLKIRRKQVIAFGDGQNDLDLLKWAGLGVAMADAPESISANANLTIPGPEEEGLARFLRGDFIAPQKGSLSQLSK